jgi:uncharacterized protein
MNQSRRDFVSLLGAAALLPISPYLERTHLALGAAAPSSRFKIRAITAGISVQSASVDAVNRAIAMLRRARARLEGAGYQVEGVRISMSPFVSDLAGSGRAAALADLQALDHVLTTEHVSLGLGPVLRADRYDPSLAEWLAELASTTQHMSFSVAIASPERGVHREASRTASEIILALSRAKPDGTANFRFAAVANMPAGSPFFPGAYHEGPPSFSIGMESPLLVLDAFAAASDPADGESRLRDSMNSLYDGVETVATGIAHEEGYDYLGIDPSPAPSGQSSIGTALEALTHVPFGSASTLQACAAVTAAIKSLRVRTCGYAGLMLPVLEDPTLANRASEGRYGLRELLLFSSVCGTGLDCVPIPGDTPAARIALVLDDVATMATRLRKPLSARLFPAPGKTAGEHIQFEGSALYPSSVFEVA